MGGRWRCRRRVWVWLLLVMMLIIVVGKCEPNEVNPCDNLYLGTPKEACHPCAKELWNFLLGDDCVNKPFFGKPDTCEYDLYTKVAEKSVSAINTRREQFKEVAGCYNKKPLINEYTKDLEIVVAKGSPILDIETAALGFNIPETPFFRYFLPPKAKARAKNDPTELEKFDIGLVKDLYVRPDQDTDFELMEWPGRTSKQMKEFLDQATIPSYGCKDGKRVEIPDTDPTEHRCAYSHNFTVLHYDGETSKFLNYPCNKKLGTNIVAFAQVQQTNDETSGKGKDPDLNDIRNDPIQKIWMSHGTDSIHRKYTQPIYIRFATLQKLLAPSYVREAIGWDSGDWECSDDSEHSEDINLKLRTVYDFTFVTDGLILGMHCGIVILRGLLGKVFKDEVPLLTSRYGVHTGFPKPINRLSSSVCCKSTGECDQERHIIAAYSFDDTEDEISLRFLYLSFDSGRTFEEKFISKQLSAINLIEGMYSMYGRFVHYYDLLNQCEPFKGNKNLEKSQESKVWRTLNAEEKEAYILSHIKSGLGRATADEFHDTLGHLYCQKTYNKSNGFSHEREVTPDWVKKLTAHRYKKYFKPDGHRVRNYTECEGVQKCYDQENPITYSDPVTESLFNEFPPKTSVNPDENCEETDEKFNWPLKLSHLNERLDTKYEPSCQQVVSIIIIEEDQDVLVLCKMFFCRGPHCEGGDELVQSEEKTLRNNIYGVYYLSPNPGIPIAVLKEWSAGYFECDLMKYKLGGAKEENGASIQPEIIRVPESSSIIIKNCFKALYYSPDMGKTILSFVFYSKKFEAAAYNSNGGGGGTSTDPSDPDPEAPRDGYQELGESDVNNKTEWIRTYRLDQLSVPPMIAVSAEGHRVLFTFKNFYAVGQINYKATSRLRVGLSFRKPRQNQTVVGKLIPEETIAIPWFKNSGDRAISVSILGFFARDNIKDYDVFYLDRHSIRLVEIPVSFFHHEAAFYDENHNLMQVAREERYGYRGCTTFNFEYTPHELKLDVRETGRIVVSVKDIDQSLSLAAFAASDIATDIHINKLTRGKHDKVDFNLHEWEVLVTMHPEEKDENQDRIDAFFGVEYSKLNQYSPTVVLQTASNSRCHVQPVGSVLVSLGCHGKIMVAHEDEHRPQKAEFIKTKKYTIRKGKYNPELARYWIENNPNFVQRNADGDLVVTYDFSTFGIPIEPFKDDPFTPDLRIVDEKIAFNSTRGTIFRGDFILIEIFGAEGFDYVRRVKDVKCKQPPQTLKKMLEEWIHRRRIFNISSSRMKRFLNRNPEKEGSPLFDPKPVYEHVNIWNRINYRNCRGTSDLDEELEEFEDEKSPLAGTRTLEEMVKKVKEKHRKAFEDVQEDAYEIMNNRNLTPAESLTCNGGEDCNTIAWHSKDRPEVFIFLAVAVDDYESFCNYHTLFAVSLPKAQELDDLLSFLCFVFFTIVWIVVILVGFWWRKSLVRQKYVEEARMERLKQAAWTVIYRYEKLLHENENKELESEIDEFSKIIQEKEAEARRNENKGNINSQSSQQDLKKAGGINPPPGK